MKRVLILVCCVGLTGCTLTDWACKWWESTPLPQPTNAVVVAWNPAVTNPVCTPLSGAPAQAEQFAWTPQANASIHGESGDRVKIHWPSTFWRQLPSQADWVCIVRYADGSIAASLSCYQVDAEVAGVSRVKFEFWTRLEGSAPLPLTRPMYADLLREGELVARVRVENPAAAQRGELH